MIQTGIPAPTNHFCRCPAGQHPGWLSRIVQHTSKDRNRTRFCAGGFEDFGGFRTCRTGGEYIIHNEDMLAPNRVRMCDCQSAALVFKSLLYRDSFLWTRLQCPFEQMDIAADLQSRGKFVGDNPCGIEVANDALPPVLRDGNNSVVRNFAEFGRSGTRKERPEGPYPHG